MVQGKSPGVRRRLLGKELAKLRKEAGLEFEHVIDELGFSKSKISRIESGAIGVSIVDAKALAQLYGADQKKTDWLVRLVRVAKQRGWWHCYMDVVVDWFFDYVSLEAEAGALDSFHIDLIPGLFQTSTYARLLMRSGAPDAADELVEKRVDLRLSRQKRVHDGDLKVWSIIDEAALRRAVGGTDVQLAQLLHLRKMAELSNVTLQLLPFAKGQHIAMGTSFSYLKFADYPSVVYVDTLTGGLYLDDEPDVSRYSLALDHLRASALDPSESFGLLDRVIAEL
ncbi:helix-turn-helix domain-containing protein [Goodfellowiella coeruleoviolacea]|uniref:Helix-turn-helix domain-containing protein n=1 Tax=Goodfellowiella coeruleoviolacea TaxID=334858 RepID=A0AAE3GJS3_9PSEU|nr:helix-turn-helix transcriptional regulator [Goodfellowiella coeruleoviolacea]MCP2169546.1 Helix-turn-helix domain-containing protein [Goodfellowiella coeruleoviolacea]